MSRDAAWAFFWQADRLAALLPGCRSVLEIEPQQRYVAEFEDRIGPYWLHFDMDIRVRETEPPRRIHLQASGRDQRLGVTQDLDLAVTLAAAGPNETVIAIVVEVDFRGKVALLGHFVIRRKMRSVVEEFAANVRRELARPA
ncbi:MAG: hypothetical protein KGJ86_04990 [Chloroflexota bacterium]|nr:hypothetical protein [Chloroflexota bacterium]